MTDTGMAEIEKVTLGGSDRPRLEGVSLTLCQGVTAVMGESGAGKTSLLNLLAGYERPDQGLVACESSVAWVPSGLGLWPGYRVREHLAEGANDDVLDALGIGAYKDAFPHTLSLGQQARVAVARALSSTAELLVMDEPLAHVDPGRRPEYWRVIRQYLGERSLIFASHEPETVLAHADRVCCLIAGQVAYEGSVCDLYERPESEALAQFLGRSNWLDPESQALWLGRHEDARCLRPECLEVKQGETGALECVSSQHLGHYSESRLRHLATKEERVFLHRPNKLSAGCRVLMQVLTVLILCCFIGACDKANEFPVIAVTEVKAWPLPIDGPKLPSPRSVATGLRDEVVVLDDSGRVLVFDKDGGLLRRWSMPDVTVGRPEGVVVLDNGEIVVCDTHYSRITVFSPEGEVVRSFGKPGRGDGEFIYPVAIAKDPDEHLYIGEYGANDRIQKFTKEGKHLMSFGSFGTGPGQFQRPSGIVWHEGRVYVADSVNNRIQVFTEEGAFERAMGVVHQGEPVPLHLPYDLVLDHKEQLLVVEYGAGRVLQASLQGELLGVYGRQGAATGQFHTPWGVTVDSRGHIRVADTGNRRLVAMRVGP